MDNILSLIDINYNNVRNFCNSFFPETMFSDRKETLETKIAALKEELMEKIQELALLDDSNKESKVFTFDALKSFFKAHPAFSIVSGDTTITLSSDDQSVGFHTDRRENSINGDMIYSTLPLYSFKSVFSKDGNVAVGINCRNKNFENDETVRIANRLVSTAHPNATTGSGGTFGSVCTGNNNFINEFSALCANNNFYDGRELLRILTKAAIWFESANLSDMYGTYMSSVYSIGQENFNTVFFDNMLEKLKHPIFYEDHYKDINNLLDREIYKESEIAKILKIVFDFDSVSLRRKHEIMLFIVYAGWLLLNRSLLHELSISRDALNVAIKYDLAAVIKSVAYAGLYQSLGHSDFTSAYYLELDRAYKITLGCPAQLYEYGLYKEGSHLFSEGQYSVLNEYPDLNPLFDDWY